MKTAGHKRNIGINYLFNVFMNLNFTSGLWMIFLAIRGFSLVELGLLEGIYHITGFLMEVPTGIIADIWGRKASRIIGRIIWSLSLALMYFSPGFALQALGFCICALGNTLESGAGDALVYDSLLLDGAEEQYVKVSGWNEFLYEASSIAAFLIGGALALSDWAWVFGLSFICVMVAIALASAFKEPVIRKDEPKNNKVFRLMWTQVAESFKVMKAKPRIAFVLISNELLFSFIVSLYFYLQVHWKDAGMNEFQIMVVFSIHSAFSGLGALFAQKVRKRFSDYNILLVVPLLLILFMAAVALTQWQQVFYVAIGSLLGLLAVVVSNYINHLIPSAQRATILSLQSMAFSTCMIVLFPLIGLVGSAFGLRIAFVAMAIVALLLYVPFAIIVRKIASTDEKDTHLSKQSSDQVC
ncbi:MAG: MFS transporter [Sphaerochaetaceae bacterium]|jgi:MFS family permease|nr:MFS transporter [Sphaerochaetaceae bacterium]MDD2406265.1 MFS transporter [Sphaerochaetaceae bacterium]MDD4260230.1 MFS transporter [Sphaerochaetaceae bacterium]MDD4841551.1 MFS transporter [Sphaerochaetaceae bacterium]NLO61204.1 MFS transporter [Spirochaetales bacterium]